MLANAAISWSSKRQPCVALSSCEAELVAGSEAAKEAVHLGRLTGELGMGSDLPVPLRMDNAAARATAYKPVLSIYRYVGFLGNQNTPRN